jgi:hypothetical protein
VDCVDTYDEGVCVSHLGYVEAISYERNVAYVLATVFGTKRRDGKVEECWKTFYGYEEMGL